MCRHRRAAAPCFIFRLKDKFRSHRYLTTAKVADVVVVKVRITGNAECSGLRTHTPDRLRTLIEQVKDLSPDLEVESAVFAETCVLQKNCVCLVESSRPQCVSTRG